MVAISTVEPTDHEPKHQNEKKLKQAALDELESLDCLKGGGLWFPVKRIPRYILKERAQLAGSLSNPRLAKTYFSRDPFICIRPAKDTRNQDTRRVLGPMINRRPKTFRELAELAG